MLAMPSVMISGLTRKTPTPMPLMRPTTRPTRIAIATAVVVPRDAWPAMMYAAAVAVAATDRSMPAVSITSVWPAARNASGAANCRIVPMRLSER